MTANMPGAMSANACDAVSAATMLAATTMPAATMSAAMSASMLAATMPATMLATTMPAATMSAATPAGVCFECEKRHDEEQRSRQASAGRQHRPHGPARMGARRRRLSLGIVPKSF
jgi:hypothetical protein